MCIEFHIVSVNLFLSSAITEDWLGCADLPPRTTFRASWSGVCAEESVMLFILWYTLIENSVGLMAMNPALYAESSHNAAMSLFLKISYRQRKSCYIARFYNPKNHTDTF